jgi:hypothetical protein
MRNAFRGTAFHNTIRIDGRDQADPAGPFRWNNKPTARVREWKDTGDAVYLDAECAYRGFVHRRRFLCIGAELLMIVDDVSGPPGEHLIEQFWHLGGASHGFLFSDPTAIALDEGLRSRVLGQKEPAPVLRATWRTALPHTCATVIDFTGSHATLKWMAPELQIDSVISVSFPDSGMPVISRS